ncbi:MAG: deoxyribose-phosphate aldolase [Treponema sp.]|jgi:deoxyribose-phosphate aldolase|nr:deoxyribose-phosphate aldolase [Treponema sp.]
MTDAEILSCIDHTLLKPAAGRQDIFKLCAEALEWRTASVCIPPCYVKEAREEFGQLNICTVAGFPLGYSVTGAKVLEAEQAVLDGAGEIDMVINITHVKNDRFDRTEEEIRLVRAACGGHTLKVIVETCYLTADEKIRLCEIAGRAGADYIKTSTGFGSAGAALEDVRLFKAHAGPELRIKAAGGIRTRDDMAAFIKAGASRIGTSSACVVAAK